MRLPGQNKSLVVAVHDGLAWRAYALQRERGEWVCIDRAEEASRAGRGLPKTILDFMAQSRAKRLRVLLSGDVYVLNAELPEDASDEELHTALAYEAQGEAGLEAAGHRLAAARAHLFDMGGERKSLLASSFEIERLNRFAANAEGEGVTFAGAGSLELAVLAAHAHRAPNRRLLIVRERTSFYVVPANDPQPFLTAMLPLGLNTTSDPTARERAERARDRLSVHSAVPLTVVLSGESSLSGAVPRDHASGAESEEYLRERIAPYVGACADVEYVALPEVEKAALRANAGGRIGGVEDACPWIGLPPPPRDPHRHGTVLLFIILAFSLVWSGWRRQILHHDLCRTRANLKAWETLENARQQVASASEALRNRQTAIIKRKEMLAGKRCLPHGLLPLLETLAEHMPAYSSLESVKQREGGGFEIVGLTRWQDGLTKLDAALREMALREGLRREFEELETIEGQYAQRFRYVLTPGEEQL